MLSQTLDDYTTAVADLSRMYFLLDTHEHEVEGLKGSEDGSCFVFLQLIQTIRVNFAWAISFQPSLIMVLHSNQFFQFGPPLREPGGWEIHGYLHVNRDKQMRYKEVDKFLVKHDKL